ncbi:MAG: hypothetical protein GX495_15050 [Chloroflexi bacterium]|jgi:uncharacterized membrane protein required for colicin V production|nr:hypothetical protein [Chloroflexota bacterium]
MMSLAVFFWLNVILFASIGAMRGWAKELMVTFSVILALFLITVLETYVGVVRNTIVAQGGTPLFWFRAIIIILLAFFGYQTPNIRALAGARFARERVQDTLLGFLLGGLNGYLVIGSVWYYMHAANYPVEFILPPSPADRYYEAVTELINFLPPDWLGIPWVYLAVGLAFVFVIIVFI